MSPNSQRKIIHIDMDAFYASVEQYDDPSLRGKPVVVGGLGPRGVIAAASYEARVYGIRSAMPSFKARRLHPNLIFVKPRFARYKEISQQIRSVFFTYTDLVEPLSLDEAYLDVSENKKGILSAIKIAQNIKAEIKETTGLTASAGVSINKFLAKVASDLHKPDGLSVILPEDVLAFLDILPIEKFYGVGKATATKLLRANIKTGQDLRLRSERELVQLLGKFGRYLYKVSRGEDDREVQSDRIRKSISVERTYGEDIEDWKEIMNKVDELVELLIKSIYKSKIKGRTVIMKIRFGDFTTLSRSKSLSHFTDNKLTIREIATGLMNSIKHDYKPIRLLGLGLSNLDTEVDVMQLTLDF